MEGLGCYVRSNRHGGELKFLYRGDPRFPVCDFHAGLVDPALLQPIPRPETRGRKETTRVTIPEALEETHVIMAAVPTGEYELVIQALKDGHPRVALRRAYVAGVRALIGLIRGRLIQKIQRQEVWAGEELTRLFTVKTAELRQIEDPAMLFDAAFQLFANLGREISMVVEIVAPARKLLTYTQELRVGVAGLRFVDDLLEELNQLSAKLQGFIDNPSGVSPEDIDEANDLLFELEARAESVRQVQACKDGDRRKQDKRGRKKTRSWNNGWQNRLFDSQEDEGEIPDNIVPIRIAS